MEEDVSRRRNEAKCFLELRNGEGCSLELRNVGGCLYVGEEMKQSVSWS